MHQHKRTPPYVRSFAFRRLSAFAVLWYFLLVLLAASMTMDIGVQLVLLLAAVIIEILFGSWERVRQSLGWILVTAGIIAVVTLIFDRYGAPRIFAWGWFAPTWNGFWTGIFLGTAFITISLITMAQSRAFSRTQLSKSRNRWFPRLSLIVQMTLGAIPRLDRRVRTLFAVERMNRPLKNQQNEQNQQDQQNQLASSGRVERFNQDKQSERSNQSNQTDRLTIGSLLHRQSRRLWATRLRTITYALLADALDDSAARTASAGIALTAPGNITPVPDYSSPGSFPLSTCSVSHRTPAVEPAEKSQSAGYRAPSRQLAARSLVFSAIATLLYIIVEAHMPQITAPVSRFHLSTLSNYCAAAALMFLPYLMEGGERLWARARA